MTRSHRKAGHLVLGPIRSTSEAIIGPLGDYRAGPEILPIRSWSQMFLPFYFDCFALSHSIVQLAPSKWGFATVMLPL